MKKYIVKETFADIRLYVKEDVIWIEEKLKGIGGGCQVLILTAYLEKERGVGTTIKKSSVINYMVGYGK